MIDVGGRVSLRQGYGTTSPAALQFGTRNAEPGTLLLSHVQEFLGALGNEVLKLRFLVVFEFSG